MNKKVKNKNLDKDLIAIGSKIVNSMVNHIQGNLMTKSNRGR